MIVNEITLFLEKKGIGDITLDNSWGKIIDGLISDEYNCYLNRECKACHDRDKCVGGGNRSDWDKGTHFPFGFSEYL